VRLPSTISGMRLSRHDNCSISSDMTLPKRNDSYLEHCRVVSEHLQSDSMWRWTVRKPLNHVYYPIIDCMTGEIERRFTKLNCGIVKLIQALNPSNSNFLDEESIALLAKAYDADMEELKHELHQTRPI